MSVLMPVLPCFDCCSFVVRRRQWHPTPVLLPGKSHGWRSLVGCSPWGCKESDTTERLHIHFSLSCTGEGNGNPLQCSCLENPSDGGAWWAAIYGVAQNLTWLKRLSSSSSSFVVSFDIGKCESSNFIPLYQYCLGYSGSLVIPYEPEDRLLVLEKKKNCWNFDRDFIELVNQLGSIAILTIVNLLPH